MNRSTNNVRGTYLLENAVSKRNFYTLSTELHMLSQEQTSLSSAVLSHLASSVPSPRVVSQEREEYERPAREKVDDPEDMPSQIHLRVQRVRSSVCHSDGTIVDGNVVF